MVWLGWQAARIAWACSAGLGSGLCQLNWAVWAGLAELYVWLVGLAAFWSGLGCLARPDWLNLAPGRGGLGCLSGLGCLAVQLTELSGCAGLRCAGQGWVGLGINLKEGGVVAHHLECERGSRSRKDSLRAGRMRA